MFRPARIKLTAWYLLIIMIISVSFSLVVYTGLTAEVRRGLHLQALRGFGEKKEAYPSEERMSPPFTPGFGATHPPYDPMIFEEIKKRIAFQMIFINLGLLTLSGFAAYFLAGRTLKPIEEMLHEQERFVADASHEQRTPLTAMKTEIEVALREPCFDQDRARGLIQSILQEIDKLKLLSDYLLTLSRYEGGIPNRDFEEVSLTEVFTEAVEKIQPLADEKRIQITSSLEDIKIQGDKAALITVFSIFLDNALKYSPADGAVIVAATIKKNKAVITVQDFGIGIRASELPYIFNRFYRADTSRTKSQVPGYGLGLAIAKTIIDRHCGRVEVKSTPGKGTTFIVSLPLKQRKKLLRILPLS
ncbi:MAG: HAMP domain-containing sensor histidine kinase [Peptococcaceae bacterium]